MADRTLLVVCTSLAMFWSIISRYVVAKSVVSPCSAVAMLCSLLCGCCVMWSPETEGAPFLGAPQSGNLPDILHPIAPHRRLFFLNAHRLFVTYFYRGQPVVAVRFLAVHDRV